jgi:polyisoprenoid-binding protein YceI
MRTARDTQVSSPRPPRPRRWRRWHVLAGVALVPVVAGIAVYGWLALQRPPAAYRLDAGAPTTAPPAAGELAGRWVVAAGSQAGYRIREKLAKLPAPNDAVGRTSDVRGEVTVAEAAGGALLARDARFEVDLTTLQSDEPQRDEKVFPYFLEPGSEGTAPRHPTASFQARAVEIPSQVRSGAPVDLVVRGQLAIRGERRDADVRIRARLQGERIELVGSTRFPLARYGIAEPDFGGFVTVDDQVTVELHLFLERRD